MYILDQITDQATATFPHDFSKLDKEKIKEIWDEWGQHWLTTAEQWKAQCLQEGLVNTAKAIDDHITWQKKYVIKTLKDKMIT